MANIGQFVFFDGDSTALTSNAYGNTSEGSAMTLQVQALTEGATISLTVEGMSDLQSEAYSPIRAICLGDYKAYSTITAPGLYMFPIDGVQKVRLKSSGGLGSFKAFAIAVG